MTKYSHKYPTIEEYLAQRSEQNVPLSSILISVSMSREDILCSLHQVPGWKEFERHFCHNCYHYRGKDDEYIPGSRCEKCEESGVDSVSFLGRV